MAEMETSIHFYEFDAVKWVVDCMSRTQRQRVLVRNLLILYALHTCKKIIQMDIRDMFIAVHTGKGEQRNMRAVTKYYFEPAYRTLDESLVLNHWFRTLKLVKPPPSGLDILDIIGDDTRMGVLWKRAVKEMVHKSWKDQRQTCFRHCQ